MNNNTHKSVTNAGGAHLATSRAAELAGRALQGRAVTGIYRPALESLCRRYPKYFSGVLSSRGMPDNGTLTAPERTVKAFRGVLNKITAVNAREMVGKAKVAAAAAAAAGVGPAEVLAVVWETVAKQGQTYGAELADIASAIGSAAGAEAAAFWAEAGAEVLGGYRGGLGRGGDGDFDDELCRYNRDARAYVNRASFAVRVGAASREEVGRICREGLLAAGRDQNLAMVYARAAVECACREACREALAGAASAGVPPIVRFKLMDYVESAR